MPFYFLVNKALVHRTDGVLNTNKVLKADNLILKTTLCTCQLQKIQFNAQEKQELNSILDVGSFNNSIRYLVFTAALTSPAMLALVFQTLRY